MSKRKREDKGNDDEAKKKGRSIPPPGDGEDYEKTAKEEAAKLMSDRELQGLAANWLMKEDIRQKDPFVPVPEFLWLISAGIKSGKTQMMIGAVRKIAKLYYRIYFLSPQRTLEDKVKSHLLPLVYNKGNTEYTPENMQNILNEMEEVHDMALASKCGSKATLAERAARGDDNAYQALCVRALWGRGARTLHRKLTPEERLDRDKLLATQGRQLLVLDDSTMIRELSTRVADARTSFMGKLVRMRHEGIDMVVIVHNRGNVSTIVKNSATVDTLFNPRSRADKQAVAETTSGLSEKGLEALVQLAQQTSQHGTVTLYKGAPEDRKYAINLNTYVKLEWDDSLPEPIFDAEPPEPAWAPSAVMKKLTAGKRLLTRISKFEKGIDPDEREVDWGLLSNADPHEPTSEQRRHAKYRRQRRRALARWNAFEAF